MSSSKRIAMILQPVILWYVLRLNESARCTEPPFPNEPSFIEIKDEYMDRAFGPLFHLLVQDQSNVLEIGLNSKNVFSQSKNKKCPKKITGKAIKEGRTSTCPSYVKFTYDKDRMPKVIPFAVCQCTDHCIPVEGCDSECQKRTRCQLVYTYKTIYTKQCNVSRFYEWVKAIAKIPVGCTCGVTS